MELVRRHDGWSLFADTERPCQLSAVTRLTLVVVVISGLAIAPVRARTWTASADGTSGDGSITEILVQYSEGDSIVILPGVHEWIQEGGLRRSATIIGSGSDEVVLLPNQVAFLDCDYLVIEGVSIRGSKDIHGSQGVDSVVFRGVEFSENQAGIHITQGRYASLTSCVIKDNVVASLAYGAAGLNVVMDRLEVIDCLFSGNVSYIGRPLDEIPGGAALLIDNPTAAVIRGCVFVGNKSNAGCAVYQETVAGNILFEHNVVVGNEDYSGAVVLNGYGDEQIVRNNIFANNIGFGLWCGDWTPRTFRVYCNVFWQNQGWGGFGAREQNNWYGLLSARGMEGLNDFYSVLEDPKFCQDGSYGLNAESPLWIPSEPCTAVPGTGRDCIVDPVIERSWGGLKQMFEK